MRALTANNVAVIDYEYEYLTPDKVHINAITLKYLNGKEKHFNDLSQLFEWCANDRIALIFTYDFNFFGGFLDYYAFTHNIPLFDRENVERGKNGFSLAQECWSALYTGAGMLNFRITLKRTKATHRQDLREGQASYHTTEFRGLAPYYGSLKLSEVREGLKLQGVDKCDLLIKLIEYAQYAYKEIGGFDFLSAHFLQSTYTIGRAARILYLKIRYGKDSLKAYQKEHLQCEELEDYFRERRLLLGGMCIANPHYRGILCMRKSPRNIKKYDVNGLYSFVANDCGELAPPELSDVDTFYSDVNGDYAYILILKGLLAYRKPDKSGVFDDPFTKIESDVIEFDEGAEYAIWGELFNALDNFYEVEEGRIIRVYRCKKIKDPAMIEYNRRLIEFKKRGKKTDNRALYVIAKIFLNSLIGKFLQATKSVTIEPYYDKENDIVRLQYGKVVDNWERQHFDFIRGSYIYSMARVKVMRDLLRVFKGKNMYYHHWYTDTDSIVTDIDFPADMVSPDELGKYKIEEKYTAFGVICKKVYYGRTVEGKDKLVAAGIPKQAVIESINRAFPDGLTAGQYFDYLNSGEPLELPTRLRISGGCGIVSALHVVNSGLPLDEL